MDIKTWLSENSQRRITDQDIATILNVTRKTANKRINEGLPLDDLLELCEALGINRPLALVELGYIPYQEVLDFLDSDGALIATADEGELAIELARRLNPATRANEIDELEQRRQRMSDPADIPLGAVAYSGPDEDAERNDAYDD
ncbi:hypothetical protein [Corynebacterium minutissimum]|uniref:hypothetical protein n=1 Tax=Corynebacterium minutissimum TaxID=38301 RepID=UPI001EF3BF14|nr:hypothetical protein [Corynebacterium minutissimum]MCG7239604.1 hypothetical protein [Corynebacterium minutissimum]